MTPTHALEREEPWDLRPEAPGGRAGARLQGPGATAESWSPQQPGGHVPEGLPGEGLEGLAVQKIPVENPRVAASDGQMPAGFCDSGNTSPVGARWLQIGQRGRVLGAGPGPDAVPRHCPNHGPQRAGSAVPAALYTDPLGRGCAVRDGAAARGNTSHCLCPKPPVRVARPQHCKPHWVAASTQGPGLPGNGRSPPQGPCSHTSPGMWGVTGGSQSQS